MLFVSKPKSRQCLFRVSLPLYICVMELWMWFKTLPLLLKYTVWVVSVLDIVCHGCSNCFLSYLSDTEIKNINPVIMQSRFWHNQPQFCLILQLQVCILNGGKTGSSCSSVCFLCPGDVQVPMWGGTSCVLWETVTICCAKICYKAHPLR